MFARVLHRADKLAEQYLGLAGVKVVRLLMAVFFGYIKSTSI